MVNWPPQQVVQNCLHGLSDVSFHQIDASDRAVKFARDVSEGGVTRADAATALQAHHDLTAKVVEMGNRWTPVARAHCLLWGGTEARPWLESLVKQPDPVAEPVPGPVSATLTTAETRLLSTVNARIAALEERFAGQVETLVEEAFRDVLRSLTRQAIQACQRIPKDLRDAGFDMDLRDQVRADMRAADRLEGWTLFAPIQAELNPDQEQQADTTLEGWRQRFNDLIEAHIAALIVLIASLPGVSREQVLEANRGLVDRVTQAVDEALEQLSGFAKQRIRADTNDLPDVPSGWVDPNITRRVLQRLAGRDNRTKTGVVTLENVLRSNLVFSIETVTTGYEWVYGSPLERFKPYQPHIDVDGSRWLEGQSPPEGQERGDHIGCRCEYREVPLIRDSGEWLDPGGQPWII